MPGLNQLIQFNKDILSLGDEIQLRAQRGEKPVRIPVPKDVYDKDDSEDFVMGMPEIQAVVQDTSVDEDLSDLQALTGTAAPSTEKESETDNTSSAFDAPDLSDLLAPAPATDSFGDSVDMPDLSMFLEPEQKEPEPEPEPEETSIADLSLEDLLGGAGFDGTAAPTQQETTSSAIEDDDLEFYSGGFGDDNYTPQKKTQNPPVTDFSDLASIDILSEIPGASDSSEPADNEPSGEALSLEALGLGDLDFGNSPAPQVAPISAPDNVNDDFSDIEELQEIEELEEISDFDEPISAEVPDLPADTFEAADISETVTENSGLSEPFDFNEPVSDDFSSFDTEPVSDFEEVTDFDIHEVPEAPESPMSFGDIEVTEDNFEVPDLETPVEADNSAEEALLSDTAGLFDAPEVTEETDFSASPELNEGFGSDFGSAEGLDSFDFENLPDFGEEPSGEATDFTADIPDDISDFSIPDSDSGADFGSDSSEMEEMPLETFDTTEMDGMNFDVPETDTQLENADAPSDDFSFENDEFTIPGFSDVQTAKEEKKNPVILGKTPSKTPEEELPPNTLSDAQYKVFLKNLSEYPLNVRLAFEDLIVKNDFTDEAEFEIIEKIINKAPARQIASHLEKMLDISIPVPRNFEHRTAEEYEAYKKSLSYQLKNKIVPAVFACFVLLVVFFGLFQFTKHCIYYPAMANHLYKQGYTMLQADEYPQSEIKFNEAIRYRRNKKWFFRYARGYRERKQYIRAEWMYQNILDNFKHDKAAGLEYANMELNDLANYQKAEEICRRQVLDFHINDADGILLLGDIFLEWGTEKDPEKLESAREQYATLIQLYKSNKLYEGRMMRYFIRTDNLPEVLSLKEYFLPKEKNLPPEDWTELSGYMLDKLYGPIAPSDEYLRNYIEDVRLLLIRAYKLDNKNPISAYNLSRYFIETNESQAAKNTLIDTLDKFKASTILHRRDLYKYIDTYRLAGEEYSKAQEYLRAQEYFTDGITLYTAERDASGLEGNKKIGQLFADQADMDYFITGDYDNALQNFISSVQLENDNPSIRYKIGYIQYKKKNYAEALGSFMKAGDGNIKETNLMLAMGNTLSMRGDNYAAQGYYENLISNLDKLIADKGGVNPQAAKEDNELVTAYLYAANNYGVTLYHLASRTGNSSFNAQAIVQFSQSVRAWDALTRNQETMVRLGGSNLAEENIKYITHPVPDFEPAIYTEIPRTIVNNEKISY